MPALPHTSIYFVMRYDIVNALLHSTHLGMLEDLLIVWNEKVTCSSAFSLSTHWSLKEYTAH